MTAPLLEIAELSFDYRDEEQTFRALHGVSLSVDRGESVAIVGASGSGKSTLLNVLGLLASPTEGRHLFLGEDVGVLSEREKAIRRRHGIGFVFQHFNLLPRLTVLENVLVPVTYLEGISAEGFRRYEERALRLLGELGVGDKAHRLPSEMSGGQKQRVAICRALILDPDLILADEPTGALDAHTTQDVLAILEGLNARGKTVIIITHDPEVAARATRRVFLKDGRVASDEIHRRRLIPAELEARANLCRTRFSALVALRHEARFAARTLMAHKLRSLLTGLGLLIGVTSIVFVAGLGEMAERAFTALFLSPTTQKVYVRLDNHGPARSKGGYWAGLDSDRDFPTFQERFAQYGRIRPVLNSDSCTLISASKSTRTRFQGVFDADEYAEMDTPLQAGRFPSEMEIRAGRPVVVLGSGAVEALFAIDHPGRAKPDFPVGEKVAATNCQVSQTFTVVGALKPQDLMFMRTDANDLVYAPTPSLIAAGVNGRFRSGFSAMPHPGVEPRWLADSLANYLSLRESGRVDFMTMVPAEILSRVRTMLAVLQTITGFIGFLCMGVGGIGIMNIMLVSVRERIREIGVSKSLGATPEQVRRQFLTESVLLCLVAGILGVVVGFTANNLVALGLAKAFPNLGGFEPVPAVGGTILALLVSGGCGILFGLYPALRASRVNPADCLREE